VKKERVGKKTDDKSMIKPYPRKDTFFRGPASRLPPKIECHKEKIKRFETKNEGGIGPHPTNKKESSHTGDFDNSYTFRKKEQAKKGDRGEKKKNDPKLSDHRCFVYCNYRRFVLQKNKGKVRAVDIWKTISDGRALKWSTLTARTREGERKGGRLTCTLQKIGERIPSQERCVFGSKTLRRVRGEGAADPGKKPLLRRMLLSGEKVGKKERGLMVAWNRGSRIVGKTSTLKMDIHPSWRP